jgi:hypothetical protein
MRRIDGCFVPGNADCCPIFSRHCVSAKAECLDNVYDAVYIRLRRV